MVTGVSFSLMSIQVRTRIGSLLLSRVEFTMDAMYDGAFDAALSEPERLESERAFGSHLFLSTSALYAPLLTSASGRMLVVKQVIMLTCAMPWDVASSTCVLCGSVW